MFAPAIENLRKATQMGVQMQQEMVRKWFTLWPGMSAVSPVSGEEVKRFQKKFTEAIAETVKKQGELMEVQFKAGLKTIEDAFQLAEAKNLEELRVQAVALWEKSFESLRQVAEVQTREFQAIVKKWAEVATKEAV